MPSAKATGKLYLVATPIGNLEDVTLRALSVLKEVSLIACEDTRHTSKLLSHYGISTPRESHHEHNESARIPRLLDVLRSGRDIALVTDAGMPLVSDPGYLLVTACRNEGIAVVPVPGASAVIAALAGSGLPADSFHFAGFLPSRPSARLRRLRELAAIPATLILFEAPHRILASLEEMVEVLGPRRACLARELTKIHEEFLHGTLPEILQKLRERPRVQGEITLVIDRGEPEEKTDSWPDSIDEHLAGEMSRTGAARNEALKRIAQQRGISRKEAYRLLLEEKAGRG